MSSSFSPTHGTEPDPDLPSHRPHWLFTAVAMVLCPAVVVAGWSVGNLATQGPPGGGDGQDPSPVTAAPAEEAVPEEAEGFVRAAAVRVDAARTFGVAFFVHGAEPERAAGPPGPAVVPPAPGHGHAVFDAASEPQFTHAFTTLGGTRVFRYGSGGGGGCLTMADPGGPRLTVLDPPSDADEYLCTRGFASAKLWEILGSSPDLEYAGEEAAELVPLGRDPGPGPERGPGAEQVSAHRYTGTFTTLMGGYDPEAEANVLSPVEEAGFELWIDGDGVPRRLVHEDGAGTGETYDYHLLS